MLRTDAPHLTPHVTAGGAPIAPVGSVSQDGDADFGADTLGALQVPANLDAVAAAIDLARAPAPLRLQVSHARDRVGPAAPVRRSQSVATPPDPHESGDQRFRSHRPAHGRD